MIDEKVEGFMNTVNNLCIGALLGLSLGYYLAYRVRETDRSLADTKLQACNRIITGYSK